MARKLRIAVSVFFGLLTVALVVLWVRRDQILVLGQFTLCDYTWELVYFPNRHLEPSRLSFAMYDKLEPMPVENTGILGLGGGDDLGQFSWKRIQIDYPPRLNGFALSLPFSYVGVAAAAMTLMPFISARTKFSLRTMLITTTLVAVVLGFAVWAGM